MKTIKEKYKEIVSGWNDERTENVSKRCEEIADDYAIEFGDFIERIKDADIDSLDYNFYLTYTMEQLLEIFKKEKGL